MDFTPPSHRSDPRSRTKAASRLAIESEEISIPTPSPSVHDLLLLSSSPSSNLRKSRSRLVDRFEMNEEGVATETAGTRRRCKNRGPQLGFFGIASPRSVRRSRRRSEVEFREEKDMCLAEEFGKCRKRRQSGKSKKEKEKEKEKLSLVPIPIISSSLNSKLENDDSDNLDRIGQLITDLIMWKDMAKSSLWFGFGSLFFFSSCFARGVSFSVFTAISQLGLLFLALAFFSNSICQRKNTEKKHDFKLKDDDILRLVKLILPAANFAISRTRELFSGEPTMTLKVAPFFIVGAEYGHLITLHRLCAIGFFTSFSVPKLYSCYQIQINQKVQFFKRWLFDAWRACSYKKVVVTSAATIYWNFSSLKTRIFTAFICLVILRYCQQFIVPEVEATAVAREDDHQAVVAAEAKREEQQALVVVEPHHQH